MPLPNVEGLTISLSPLSRPDFFISRKKLLKILHEHYKGELLRSLLKLVLHTDVTSTVVTFIAAKARDTPAARPPRPLPDGGGGGNAARLGGMFSGLAKGLGKGLAGAAAKPTAACHARRPSQRRPAIRGSHRQKPRQVHDALHRASPSLL